MNVLEGPRREVRRVLAGGTPCWVTPSPDGSELRLPNGTSIEAESATHLPPCDPTKIICVHVNYESRLVEFRLPTPSTPTYFQKPLTALNSHGGTLSKPDDAHFLNYEGEVAVVIGRPMRNVGRDEVWDGLAGFAPGNDVGLHDFRDTDLGSLLRVKGQDGFCPVGPGVVAGVDIRDCELRTYLNGRVVQRAAVADMVFPIDYVVADLTRHITLLPGDVILTGTPENSRPMAPGDVVEVEVSGVGRLANTVVSSPAPAHGLGYQPVDNDSVRRVACGGDWLAHLDAEAEAEGAAAGAAER